MHELSIAMSIVELAEEEAERRGVRIDVVHLKLGALSVVVKEALLSCYEMREGKEKNKKKLKKKKRKEK